MSNIEFAIQFYYLYFHSRELTQSKTCETSFIRRFAYAHIFYLLYRNAQFIISSRCISLVCCSLCHSVLIRVFVCRANTADHWRLFATKKKEHVFFSTLGGPKDRRIGCFYYIIIIIHNITVLCITSGSQQIYRFYLRHWQNSIQLTLFMKNWIFLYRWIKLSINVSLLPASVNFTPTFITDVCFSLTIRIELYIPFRFFFYIDFFFVRLSLLIDWFLIEYSWIRMLSIEIMRNDVQFEEFFTCTHDICHLLDCEKMTNINEWTQCSFSQERDEQKIKLNQRTSLGMNRHSYLFNLSDSTKSYIAFLFHSLFSHISKFISTVLMSRHPNWSQCPSTFTSLLSPWR